MEFKTEPRNELSLKGRFFRETYPAGENVQRIHFENEQVRITRLIGVTGKPLALATRVGEPALLVALADLELVATRGDAPRAPLKVGLGRTEWVAADQRVTLENVGPQAAEMLRFDFKTRPMTPEELSLKMKKHEHK